MDGTLHGWQGRYIGNPPKYVPKYFTMPTMKKTELLYNLDQARNFNSVVLVEGVTDVWKVGPASVAMFGKTLSRTSNSSSAPFGAKARSTSCSTAMLVEDAQEAVQKLQGRVGKCILVELPDDA